MPGNKQRYKGKRAFARNENKSFRVQLKTKRIHLLARSRSQTLITKQLFPETIIQFSLDHHIFFFLHIPLFPIALHLQSKSFKFRHRRTSFPLCRLILKLLKSHISLIQQLMQKRRAPHSSSQERHHLSLFPLCSFDPLFHGFDVAPCGLLLLSQTHQLHH